MVQIMVLSMLNKPRRDATAYALKKLRVASFQEERKREWAEMRIQNRRKLQTQA